ncbi:hypothetical protein [Gorillibacterium sp. sgz5001074]|uniref:hypothetical protein n=1 Tax=Gorillibacterium sp. sgz5001074 TaxID=3446695 RepID=UPI003F664C74
MSSHLLTLPLRLMFYTGPRYRFTVQEAEVYERLLQEAARSDGTVRYDSPYPKWRFIQYVVRTKPVVLHGSNHAGIRLLEPAGQTRYDGTPVNAVFATRDAIWSLFFAVLDRGRAGRSIRNACIGVLGSSERFYLFSRDRAAPPGDPWTWGTVYFLPMESFRKSGNGVYSFNEWVNPGPVAPIASIEVGPEDFPFRHRLACHDCQEPLWRTWLLYKWRCIMRKQANTHHHTRRIEP